MSTLVAARDDTCRLSNSADGSENAHVIPQARSNWFYRNNMEDYNHNRRSHIQDLYNGFLLRADLRKVFDLTVFAFVAKKNQWTVHVIEHTRSTGRIFHNRTLHREVYVKPQFMYARFALSIFSSALGNAFENKGPTNLATIAEGDDSEDQSGGPPPKKAPKKASSSKSQTKAQFGQTAPKASTSKASASKASTSESRPRWRTSKHRLSNTSTGTSVEWEPSIPFSGTAENTAADISNKADYLLETEHPAEIWQTLYPPVGCTYPSRLANAVRVKMRERDVPRQYWDPTWRPEDQGPGGAGEYESMATDQKMNQEAVSGSDRVRLWQQGVSGDCDNV
jgi:hypothetical protein